MQVRADEDAQPRARVHVDVRIHAALADQAEARKPFEQLPADLRALTNQDEGLEVAQTLRERVGVLQVIVEHGHLVRVEQAEAVELPQRVEVVVEDRYPHR